MEHLESLRTFSTLCDPGLESLVVERESQTSNLCSVGVVRFLVIILFSGNYVGLKGSVAEVQVFWLMVRILSSADSDLCLEFLQANVLVVQFWLLT